jgi:hypothetical protein
MTEELCNDDKANYQSLICDISTTYQYNGRYAGYPPRLSLSMFSIVNHYIPTNLEPCHVKVLLIVIIKIPTSYIRYAAKKNAA